MRLGKKGMGRQLFGKVIYTETSSANHGKPIVRACEPKWVVKIGANSG